MALEGERGNSVQVRSGSKGARNLCKLLGRWSAPHTTDSTPLTRPAGGSPPGESSGFYTRRRNDVPIAFSTRNSNRSPGETTMWPL